MPSIWSVASPALKSVILDGLRRSPDPIPIDLIASHCGVSHLMTTDDVQDCMDQLVEKGLVRRTSHPAYEAANRWGGAT